MRKSFRTIRSREVTVLPKVTGAISKWTGSGTRPSNLPSALFSLWAQMLSARRTKEMPSWWKSPLSSYGRRKIRKLKTAYWKHNPECQPKQERRQLSVPPKIFNGIEVIDLLPSLWHPCKRGQSQIKCLLVSVLWYLAVALESCGKKEGEDREKESAVPFSPVHNIKLVIIMLVFATCQ